MDPAESGANLTSSGSVAGLNTSGRERFGREELPIVLSHFDIGAIESILEYPRGSRKAPKLLITSEQGRFLMKRRAKGRDDPFKVGFCHAVQLYLAERQFPLPHLIGTRKENNSMLQWRGGVYELFEYIDGKSFPQTLEATFESGRALGLFHKLLDGFENEWKPSTGSYHMTPTVETGLRAIPSLLARSGQASPAINTLLDSLLRTYSKAAENAEKLGLDRWPKGVVHADWHPGNMLFQENHVVAVIDYDSARIQARVLDVANGALQFSIIGGSLQVDKWPDYVDESRFKRFLRGYDEAMLLSEAEIAALPWLMIEALIAEAVFPIAATGQFGRTEGLAFLEMVSRKVAWMQQSAERLIESADG